MPNYFKFQGFKVRSLPNSRTIGRYILPYIVLFIALLIYNFINITLIVDGFPIEIPNIMIVCVPIVFVVVYYKIETELCDVNHTDIYSVITLIQMKHSQELLEELERRPELLKRKYKNKSLLLWAKHYNNLEAHSIITKQMHIKKS